MSNFQGVAVYEIKSDGCLIGTWTNSETPGKVMSECARKIDTETDRRSIPGEYKVTFIEVDEEVIHGKLTITQTGDTFTFRWDLVNSTVNYVGVGMKSGENQISVSYLITK